MPAIQRNHAVLLLSLLAASPSSAGVLWLGVERSAVTRISPGLAYDEASSTQILGGWSGSASCEGPPVPELWFERASASASHVSNVGLGDVPWVVLTGWAQARNAVPLAFGESSASVRLEATFSLTESTDFGMDSLRGAGYRPEAQIGVSIRRGSELVYGRQGPEAFSDSGTLDPGVYTLVLMASFAGGDTSFGSVACDLRFTLPSPGAGAVLATGLLLRRRRT